MPLVIHAGTAIRDLNGALVGMTRDDLVVYAQPLPGLGVSFLAARDAFWTFNAAVHNTDRLACLRFQARRKGRPGWRSIRIPRRLL
jgi:hypothetical protein